MRFGQAESVEDDPLQTLAACFCCDATQPLSKQYDRV
jgi:hypothetical protein